MAVDVRDEDLMTRFLLGDVTPDEQERVEQEFMRDAGYMEQLAGLEHELILQHVKNEMPDAWRARFETAFLASPARRRRVDEVAALHGAIQATTGASASSGASHPRPWLTSRPGLAAAAGIVLVAAAGWFLSVEPPPPPATTPVAGGTVTAPVATMFLAGGQVRSAAVGANVFAAPGPGVSVTLQLRVAADAPLTNPLVELQRVGGGSVAGPAAPKVETADAGTLAVSWSVPGSLVPPGDYLLTLTAQAAGGERMVVETRFFGIE